MVLPNHLYESANPFVQPTGTIRRLVGAGNLVRARTHFHKSAFRRSIIDEYVI